ncbi:isoprenyl transferase [soil metagenome]
MPGHSSDNLSSHRPIPHHVAIIMDGNGRWAGQRNLPRIAGHEAGTENIRRVTIRAAELGVRYLTLWAFSTENWRRPADEVEGILRILGETLPTETEELNRHGARLHHIGTLEGLSAPLVAGIKHAMELTQDNTAITLTLAFNYGGRDEIVRAVRRMLADGIDPDGVDEALIDRYLYTAGMPDPDLIIRTSGEMRTSNFMLWQSAFAEYHFTTKFWPEFSPDDLEAAVEDYQTRERRFGGLVSSEASEPKRR